MSNKKDSPDSRGSLRVMFNSQKLKDNKFIFDFCTTSKKNVLRGFHFQYKHQQAKFVNVLKGKILDCVVDLRKRSKTYGKTFKIILSEKIAWDCISLKALVMLIFQLIRKILFIINCLIITNRNMKMVLYGMIKI